MKTKPRVGFIGVGLMGRPMVQNLLRQGYDLVLWNRTRTKAEIFADRAEIADSPAELMATANMVITMLETGDVVDQLIFQSAAYKRMASNSIFIDMSSIAPAMARRHAQLLDGERVHYLDAPVSGGTVGAQQATLAVMVGGQKKTFERVRKTLQIFGTPHYMGPAGAGQVAKLANQAIVGITIGAVSEALLLAAEGGADPVAVRQALMGGFAASRVLELHGERMLKREFTPGATARVQLKDMQLICSEAQSYGLNLPLTELTRDSYLRLIEAGHEQLDHSGLLLQIEQLNGRSLQNSKQKINTCS